MSSDVRSYPDIGTIRCWLIWGLDASNPKKPAGINGLSFDWKNNLGTRKQAEAAMRLNKAKGIGILPGIYDGKAIVGFDLDQAAWVDDRGTINPREWAKPILNAAEKAGVYVATSTGRHGFHIVSMFEAAPTLETKYLPLQDILGQEPPLKKSTGGKEKTAQLEVFGADGNKSSRENYLALSGQEWFDLGTVKAGGEAVVETVKHMVKLGTLTLSNKRKVTAKEGHEEADGGASNKQRLGTIKWSPMGLVNALAWGNLDALFPKLFPAAEKKGRQWRLDVEGSVHLAAVESGMRDFREEEGRSFVDLLDGTAFPEYQEHLHDEYKGAEGHVSAALMVLRALADAGVKDIDFMRKLFRARGDFGAIHDGAVNLFALQKSSFDVGVVADNALPITIREFADALASHQGQQSAVARAALVLFAAALIPRQVRLHVEPTWIVKAGAFVLIVGPSSSGKTPLLSAIMHAVEPLDMELNAAWNHRKRAKTNRPGRPLTASQINVQKDAQTDFNPADTGEADDGDEHVAPLELQSPRLLKDWSHEALAIIMEQWSRGVILTPGEFQTAVGSMLNYSKDGGSAATGFLNEAWSGKSYSSVRVNRANVFINECHLSIVSTITDDELLKLLPGMATSGFAQRFMFVRLPPSRETKGPSVPEDLRRAAATVLRFIYNMRSADLRMSSQAKHAYTSFQTEVRALNEKPASRYVTEARGKSTEMALRIAIALHVLKWADNKRSGSQEAVAEEIKKQTMQVAITFIKEYHWPAVEHTDARIAEGEDMEDAKTLARRLLKLWTEKKHDVDNADLRDSSRHFKGAANWHRFERARDRLMKLGWIEPTSDKLTRFRICDLSQIEAELESAAA